MAIFRNQTIKGQVIVLDENAIEHCVIEDCQIIYRGGDVRLDAEMNDRCTWTFEGAALKTIRLLQMIGMIPADANLTVVPTTRDPGRES